MKKANLSNFWNFLTKQRKRQIYLLILLMIITSILEVMSLGAVLPFLGVLADPEKVFNHEITAIFNSFFNITRAEQLYIPFTLLFVSLAILSGFARIALLYVMTKFSFATGADFSIDIYRRTLYQSYSIHVGRNSSDVISGIVSKTGKVSGVILNVLTLVSSFFIVIGTISLLFAINVLIALSVMSFFSFFYILVVSYTRNKLKKNGEVISIHSTQVIKSLQEGLGGIRDIIIDGSQKFYCKLYRNSDLPLRKAAGNNVFISGSPRFIMETLAMVLIATLALMLSLNNEGLMSAIPMLGALALAAQRLLPIIQQAYAAYSSIIGSKASLVDIIELLNQPYPNNINKPQDVLSFNTNIKISNISFGYRDNEINVLNNVNIDIEKGDRVGFIGTTGSGKSTLVDIIMALLIPDSGFISVDNVRIDKKNSHSWQSHISHVPQSIFFSDSTIEQNIAFGVDPDEIDSAKVKDAAKQAKISNFIENLKDGYNTKVGERGVAISGGQRQRIGIARALYKNTDVLIFDEATSALDVKTESDVMESIKRLNKNLTILIIAHRLETLKACNKIYEIKDGTLLKRKLFD